MQKFLYSFVALFSVWFASTACFPISVGSPTRPNTPPLADNCQENPDGSVICGDIPSELGKNNG